jgi:hypothetical protein
MGGMYARCRRHPQRQPTGGEMNPKQQRVMEILRADTSRDLYEAGGPTGKGTGVFYVTYSAEEVYSPLIMPEVRDLEERGLVKRKWASVDGCFVLTDSAFAKTENV